MHTYIHMHTHIHTYIHTFIFIHTCTHAHILINLYIRWTCSGKTAISINSEDRCILIWKFLRREHDAEGNDAQARIQEISNSLNEVKGILLEMDKRLNQVLEPLLTREAEIEEDIKRRVRAKDLLERQLLVTKGKPIKVLNEIKRMQLELEELGPELRPIKQRIVSTRYISISF